MTDEEIIQYLDTINPIYTDRMKKNLSAIFSEMSTNDDECKRLNLMKHSPPLVEIIDQETWNQEQERQSMIRNQLQRNYEKSLKLRAEQQIAHFMAELQGVREEKEKLSQMPRKDISDIQKQAEILNILDNRCLQLQEVIKLIRMTDVSQRYTISYGDISDLRGSWEDAIDAVSLETENGTILYSDGRTSDGSTVAGVTELAISTDDHELVVFHAMEKLCFKEIAICVDSEKLVLRVSARDKKVTAPFRTLGLTMKNEISLNKQGEVFMALAKGNFYPEAIGMNKAISRLSRSLRQAFATKDSPFLKNEPQFKLYIPKDQEEKRRAIHRTVTYNDNIATINNEDSADDFLRQHDPDYDPNDPLYSVDRDA